MKPIIVKIFIGLVGFGGGFAAGFLAHKKMTELKFEEVSEEEFQQIEQSVASDTKTDSHDKSSLETSPVSEDIGAAQNLPDDPDEMRNQLQGKTPFIKADEEQKMAYEKLWKATKNYSSEENANSIPTFNGEKLPEEDGEDEHPSEEDFDEDFLERIEQEAVEAGNNFAHPPYQVDLAGFWNDHPEFDHITINYYEPDNVWLDERDEIIADISSYIGSNQDLFKQPGMDNDPDVRFICNERYGTNYEIIRHHRSYKETVGE
jgi:hypothetical protein